MSYAFFKGDIHFFFMLPSFYLKYEWLMPYRISQTLCSRGHLAKISFSILDDMKMHRWIWNSIRETNVMENIKSREIYKPILLSNPKPSRMPRRLPLGILLGIHIFMYWNLVLKLNVRGRKAKNYIPEKMSLLILLSPVCLWPKVPNESFAAKLCCIPFILFRRKNMSAELWPMQSSIGNVAHDIWHVTRPDKWHVKYIVL